MNGGQCVFDQAPQVEQLQDGKSRVHFVGHEAGGGMQSIDIDTIESAAAELVAWAEQRIGGGHPPKEDELRYVWNESRPLTVEDMLAAGGCGPGPAHIKTPWFYIIFPCSTVCVRLINDKK